MDIECSSDPEIERGEKVASTILQSQIVCATWKKMFAHYNYTAIINAIELELLKAEHTRTEKI